MAKELAKQYDPKNVEDRIYDFWLKGKYFHAKVENDKVELDLFVNNEMTRFAQGGESIRGDLNADGVVDVDDVNIAINVILKVNTNASIAEMADLNEDGTVDVDDLNIIINIILTH